jgi:apolipoprotein D and lipocalin family protein
MNRSRGFRSWRGLLVGWLAAIGCGCSPAGRELPPLPVMAQVDVQRYAGTWYEIASYPHRFQKGCVATRAVYTLRDDNQIDVVNECRQETLEGPLRSVKGRARVVEPSSNAKLEVSFFRPFWGDYWIIGLDPDYRWAVVGHPSRQYLWVLSRTRTLDETVYRQITSRLPALGYDPVRLQRTPQPPE